MTKVVVRSKPSNLTTAPDKKRVPLTVRVNSASPAILLEGEMLEILGAGLFTVNG